ncbi:MULTISPECIES: CHAT domain-containing protein [unclassified Brevundimonas]|uniref:CHAT domain-containing protein n=1 Tax=unclassified Brevundimonas TaxID=2622653 RepID=UPI0025C6D5FE|nr:MULTISPECIES: CHAT domain-containing protein [unclassified Brevundimonas]
MDHDKSLLEQIGAFVQQAPNVLGGSDILCIGGGPIQNRAGALIAILTAIRMMDGTPALLRYMVVVPPGSDLDSSRDLLRTEFLNSLERLEGEPVTNADAWFEHKVAVVAAKDRWAQTVTDLVTVQPERTAILVMDASGYRDDAIDPYIAPGAVTPLQAEDVWAPQIHGLAARITLLAREKTLYVALDVGEFTPRRAELSDLLLSIDGCGVMGGGMENDPSTYLSEHADQWDAWIRDGRLGRALKDLDTLPQSLETHKAFLKVQLLHKAGHFEQALHLIRKEIDLDGQLNGNARVKLARIAEDANASGLAAKILAPAIEVLANREDLESALATAEDIGATALEVQAAERLQALFPGSASLRDRRQRDALLARDHDAAAAVAEEQPSDEASALYFRALSKAFAGDGVPDYQGLIASAGENQSLADAYRMACVGDALARNLVVHAFDLAVPLPKTNNQQQRGERLLLRTLEQILLSARSDGGGLIDMERFADAVLELIQRLAQDPTNRNLRVRLIALVQPSLSGTTGLAVLAVVVLRLASRPVALRKGSALGTAGMDWLMDRKAFLEQAFAFLSSEQPVVIGRLSLPKALMTEPADEVVSAIVAYLNYAPAGDEADNKDLLRWLALGAAAVPHTSDPDYDLRMIRLVAGKLASSGEAQEARDLAELALLNGAGSPRRRRLAWFAMADIYNRCGIQFEALMAIACTFAADVSGDEEEIYQEVAGLARIFRDCGLMDQAMTAIGKARTLLDRMGHQDQYGHQLDTLALQIRQKAMFALDANANAFEQFLVDAAANLEAAFERNGGTAPAGVLLGQALRVARLRKISVPASAEALFERARREAKGALGHLMEAMAATTPSAADLLAVAGVAGATRYSDDAGFDGRYAAVLAARALSDNDFIADAEQTSLALELLTDRGVALPEWDEAAAPPPPPKTTSEPADTAAALSKAGLTVVQAGFDEAGRLVTVTTSNGMFAQPVREPEAVITQARLNAWSVDFPYAYGIDETSANLFYTTTADLRVSALPEGRVVIVADIDLQAFPPNLLFIDDDFAGRTRPLAAAPSLAWLGRAMAKGMIGDGRSCAWISTAVGGDDSETLPMIAQRLEATLGDHDFLTDHGPHLPATFAGASLAVIAAHGGVHPDGKFFQVVSDEGVLRVGALDLANALRNVGVVILFVCSAGRADRHPGANTTVGLAKQILDRGCAAVVASPWPLDARVPSHWLPAFLEHWMAGDSLIDAVFKANAIVDRAFAHDPARGLAMAVYGNPLLRRQTAVSGSLI